MLFLGEKKRHMGAPILGTLIVGHPFDTWMTKSADCEGFCISDSEVKKSKGRSYDVDIQRKLHNLLFWRILIPELSDGFHNFHKISLHPEDSSAAHTAVSSWLFVGSFVRSFSIYCYSVYAWAGLKASKKIGTPK